ncbi:uncharacterized protein J4E87_003911 [Alternaria ethzedia]|uniref:uncharacterized protein n=1 Tax=Alternaria ethzedia TaxID=181014 RepID=UPI0020C466FE|nr:uncharacterized protein J4E87_003911 [Alternaria ethzedia]KAI4627348.1 hypothetical protein J4E87_003911 [Alternaria ethzedia]
MGALNRRLRDLEGNPLIPSLPEVLPAIKTRLAKALPKMVSLVELSITHRKDVDISGLRATFQRHEVTLPKVLRLRILSHGDWSFLVEACPNTETLALEYNLGHDGLMETVATLKRLKLVEICCDAWQLEDIQRLHQYLPDLQSLVLRGAIGHEQISSFATAFGLFQRLTNLSITARQEITDEDEEEQFSDDDSGDGSAVGDMYWEHELDEEQSFVARSFFEHCHVLETLSLVRVGETTPWYPVRGNDGALESVYSPQMDRQAWNDTYMLERQEHDDEGFPRLFTFRRQTEYDESWDNPSYEDQSREATEHRLKERDRYYAIKQEALGLGLWEGDSRWHG